MLFVAGIITPEQNSRWIVTEHVYENTSFSNTEQNGSRGYRQITEWNISLRKWFLFPKTITDISCH